MPAITIADLENAKKDVDHIADIANSTALTATDRLGNVKRTVAGVLSDIDGIAADVATVAGVAADVTTTAQNIADVSTVATNLPVLAAAVEAIEGSKPGFSLIALAGDEDNVLAFDVAETNPAYEARKVVNGAASTGSLTALGGSGIVWGAKMVTNADGMLQWNRHNIFRETNAPDGASWVRGNLDVTLGQTDSDGGTSAFLLSATGVEATLRQSRATDQENWHTASWIVRQGTAGFCWVDLFDGTTHRYAWFNLGTGAWATVDAGLSTSVSSNRVDGTALPAGYKRILVSIRHSATSTTVDIGPCDADASKAVTVGRTMYAEKLHLHRGSRAMEFLANTSASAEARGAPYDYSTGARRLYLEPSTTYLNTYSEDLTRTAWVKTNVSAAFNATGPSGSTCSTLTATAMDGTCLQTVSLGTARVFNCFVRRKTGVGAISITIDNGVTWKDITASLSSSTYTRFAVGGGADSVFGFKISSSGDEIEVAYNLLFNHPQAVVGEAMFRSPCAVWSSSSANATIGDAFRLQSSLWSGGYANGFSFYADYDRPPNYAGYSDITAVNAAKSDYTQYIHFTTPANGADGRMRTVTPNDERDTYIYLPTTGERMEITMSSGDDRNVMSINGDPIATHSSVDSNLGVRPNLGVPVVDFIELAALSAATPGHSMFLRRFVLMPRPVNPRELRTWRYSGRHSHKWNALHDVVLCGELPNTKGSRQPCIQIISNDGDSVDIAVFACQRHIQADFHNEAPTRLIQRNYRYTKSTNTLRPITDISVCFEEDRWESKLGHTHSPTVFRVPYGTYEGEWRMVFCDQDSATGTFSDDNRSLWTMVNRRKDCHPSGWSAPTKLMDANSNAYNYGSEYIIPLENCEPLIFPPDHAVAPGRVCIPLYDSTNANCRVLYTDTFGGANGNDWLLGPSNVYSGVATMINEPTASFWPDGAGSKMGTAIYTWRTWNEAPENQRVWGTSTDGITITYKDLIPNYQGSECSAGTAQLDPDGSKTGTNYGKIVISRPEHWGAGKTRQGTRLSFATDATMEFRNDIFLWYRQRPFGYSSIKLLENMTDDGTGGPLCALTVEGSSNGGQNDSNVYLLIVPMPAW